MITRQRPKQPLERAVAKALARRAELREQELARQQAEQAAADALATVSANAAEATTTDELASLPVDDQQPPRAAGPHASAASGQRGVESTADTSPVSDASSSTSASDTPPGNGILPPAAMGLIERLANRSLDEPIDEQLEADLSKMQLGLSSAREPMGEAPMRSTASSDPDILAHVKNLIAETDSETETETKDAPVPEDDSEARIDTKPATDTEANRTAASGAIGQGSAETADPTPESASDLAAKTPSGGASFDAFQLLLKSNPDADDNTRSDLRDAPSMRNPRKFLNDEAAPSAEADEQDTRAASSDQAPEKDQERSFRNWFSPKQDPNPPPPPEQDPTRD